MSRAVLVVLLAALTCACGPSKQETQEAVAAFETVRAVFQHPRCQNCHIAGDEPLQFDGGLPHAMGVVRGPDGHGAPGQPCSAPTARCSGRTPRVAGMPGRTVRLKS